MDNNSEASYSSNGSEAEGYVNTLPPLQDHLFENYSSSAESNFSEKSDKKKIKDIQYKPKPGLKSSPKPIKQKELTPNKYGIKYEEYNRVAKLMDQKRKESPITTNNRNVEKRSPSPIQRNQPQKINQPKDINNIKVSSLQRNMKQQNNPIKVQKTKTISNQNIKKQKESKEDDILFSNEETDQESNIEEIDSNDQNNENHQEEQEEDQEEEEEIPIKTNKTKKLIKRDISPPIKIKKQINPLNNSTKSTKTNRTIDDPIVELTMETFMDPNKRKSPNSRLNAQNQKSKEEDQEEDLEEDQEEAEEGEEENEEEEDKIETTTSVDSKTISKKQSNLNTNSKNKISKDDEIINEDINKKINNENNEKNIDNQNSQTNIKVETNNIDGNIEVENIVEENNDNINENDNNNENNNENKINWDKGWNVEYNIKNPLAMQEESEIAKALKARELGEKRKIRWYLYQMEQSGIPVSKRYELEDDIEEMKFEAAKLKKQSELKHSSKTTWSLFCMGNEIVQIILQKMDPNEPVWNTWTKQVESKKGEYMMMIRAIHRKKMGYFRSNPKAQFFFTFGVQAATFFLPIFASKLLNWGKEKLSPNQPPALSSITQQSQADIEKSEKRAKEMETKFMEKINVLEQQNQQGILLQQKLIEELSESRKEMKAIMFMQFTQQNQPSPQIMRPHPNQFNVDEENPALRNVPKPIITNSGYTGQTIKPFVSTKIENITKVKNEKIEKIETKENENTSESDLDYVIQDDEKEDPNIQQSIINTNIPDKSINPININEKSEKINENPNNSNNENNENQNVSPIHMRNMQSIINKSDESKNQSVSSTPNKQQKKSLMGMFSKVDPNANFESDTVGLMANTLSGFCNPILSQIRQDKKENPVPNEFSAYDEGNIPSPIHSENEDELGEPNLNETFKV